MRKHWGYQEENYLNKHTYKIIKCRWRQTPEQIQKRHRRGGGSENWIWKLDRNQTKPEQNRGTNQGSQRSNKTYWRRNTPRNRNTLEKGEKQDPRTINIGDTNKDTHISGKQKETSESKYKKKTEEAEDKEKKKRRKQKKENKVCY